MAVSDSIFGEPEGGVSHTQADAVEPDRNVDVVTESLLGLEQGDLVDLTIGIGEMFDDVRGKLLTIEHDTAGFDHRLNFIGDVQDNGWGRLYITGAGLDALDPWQIVGAPYHVPSKTGDMRDFAAHGWVVAAEEVPDA